MAAKNLKECITQAICIGPAKEVPERLKNEIQDFLAHEVMIFGKDLKPKQRELLIEFFNHVFRKE